MHCTHRHGWRRGVFHATAWSTAVTLVCSTIAVAADAPAPTNIDVLTRMTQEIAEELYAKFVSEVGTQTVELRAFGATEDYTLVGTVFTSVLMSHGVSTVAVMNPAAPRPNSGTNTTPATGNPHGAASTGVDPSTVTGNTGVSTPSTSVSPMGTDGRLLLTFQNVSFGISYPDVYRSHMIGGKRVKRRADVRIVATLTQGGSGEVLWVGEGSREHEDEFDFGDSARVEQGLYAFSRPVLPEGGWGRYAEPIFVTGIIVGLVYLFFSNQSDN